MIKCESSNEESEIHKSFLYHCVGADAADDIQVCHDCQKRLELSRTFYLLCYRSSLQELSELNKISNHSTETFFIKTESESCYETDRLADIISFEISTKEEPELVLHDETEEDLLSIVSDPEEKYEECIQM
jgi:hypothetical protein